MSDHAQNLRQAADEIRREGHAGWGNACEWAADEIERLTAALRHEADCVDAAKAEIERLTAALNTCVWALRQPLDEWKGECERKALDAARDALKEQR